MVTLGYTWSHHNSLQVSVPNEDNNLWEASSVLVRTATTSVSLANNTTKVSFKLNVYMIRMEKIWHLNIKFVYSFYLNVKLVHIRHSSVKIVLIWHLNMNSLLKYGQIWHLNVKLDICVLDISKFDVYVLDMYQFECNLGTLYPNSSRICK